MFGIDASTLFVSLLFMFAIISPFVYYGFKNKKLQRTQLENFQSFAKSIGVTPAKIENWRNLYLLGLDPNSKILIYFKDGSNQEKSFINLVEVIKINIYEKSRIVELGVEKRNVIDYLGIQFIFKDHYKPEKIIEIYDAELFSGQDGESVLAKKWVELLRNQLNN